MAEGNPPPPLELEAAYDPGPGVGGREELIPQVCVPEEAFQSSSIAHADAQKVRHVPE